MVRDFGAFVGLLFLELLFAMVLSQDPIPCQPRTINCFSCNSSENPFCLDVFPKREVASPRVKTIECLEDCFKWLYIDRNNKRHLIRGCSAQLHLDLDRHLICMYESRSRGGYICFCTTDRCNGSSRFAFSLTVPLIALLSYLAPS
uniref:UPAR/Ly6 domain-containing protein qvr n=2 Tax=Schistocephalus solidus TaxID=70667 RepID=A0A0X3PW25_SCHSO